MKHSRLLHCITVLRRALFVHNVSNFCWQTKAVWQDVDWIHWTSYVNIIFTSGGSTEVAWGGWSHPKKASCHPSSHPKSKYELWYLVYTQSVWKFLVPPLAHSTPPLEPPQIQMCRTATDFYVRFSWCRWYQESVAYYLHVLMHFIHM